MDSCDRSGSGSLFHESTQLVLTQHAAVLWIKIQGKQNDNNTGTLARGMPDCVNPPQSCCQIVQNPPQGQWPKQRFTTGLLQYLFYQAFCFYLTFIVVFYCKFAVLICFIFCLNLCFRFVLVCSLYVVLAFQDC